METSSSAGRKLSVAMIARDAEATIAAALDSVRAIADEIIVVDTGSTDRTRQLARARSSKLLDFPWSNDFSAARNFAIEHLSGDWVLWIDASEQLDEFSAKEIRRRLDARPQPDCAFAMTVQIPAGPGQVDGEEALRTRLWPIHSGMKFNGRVREQLKPELARAGLALQTTDWRLVRSTRSASLAIKAEKAKRDLRLAQLELAEHSERPQVYAAMGDACLALGHPEQAGEWFRRAVEKSPRASTEQLEAYYGLLTSFDGRLAFRDEQIATCVKALEIFPLDSQLLCAMGSYLQAQGRLDLAGRSYQMAVEHGQINLHAWHLVNLDEHALVCYSLALDLQGQADEASRVLAAGIARHHRSQRLRRQLIDLHIKHNRRREAMAEADQFQLGEAQRNELRNAIRGACLAAQQQWNAALVYLQNAYQAGCHDPICMRWLAAALLSTGNSSAAESILRQWRSYQPENPEPARMLLGLPAQQPTIEGALHSDREPARPRRWIDTTHGASTRLGTIAPPAGNAIVNH